MRVAIIDLGTNTFNLLVAELDGTGTLCVLHSEERAVFLGRGGIERGVLADEAMDRGMEALRDFVGKSRAMGAERITGFGTSALRNARNAHVFVGRARRELNLSISVISGEEEAALILDGVRQSVTFTSKPMLVMDIGGGSIEFILATEKSLMWKRSFELGATRLLERFSPSDPLTMEEYFRICAYLDARLEPLFAVMDRHWPTTLVGSAGSFDTLAELIAAEQGNALEPHLNTFSFDRTTFDAIKDRLMGSTRADRSDMKAIPEYRVDTLPLALIAIERLRSHDMADIRWSRFALKEGAAWRALREPT